MINDMLSISYLGFVVKEHGSSPSLPNTPFLSQAAESAQWKERAIGADDRALEDLVVASATRAELAGLGDGPAELFLNAAIDHPYSPFIHGQTQSPSGVPSRGTPPSSFSFQPME